MWRYWTLLVSCNFSVWNGWVIVISLEPKGPGWVAGLHFAFVLSPAFQHKVHGGAVFKCCFRLLGNFPRRVRPHGVPSSLGPHFLEPRPHRRSCLEYYHMKSNPYSTLFGAAGSAGRRSFRWKRSWQCSRGLEWPEDTGEEGTSEAIMRTRLSTAA